MLDMVIAFDTTGSMCAYIEAVKLNIMMRLDLFIME